MKVRGVLTMVFLKEMSVAKKKKLTPHPTLSL